MPTNTSPSSVGLSVVVPAYNEAENLKPLFERLVAVCEPLGTFEVIIVDDGSSDETLAVAKELHGADPRLRYLSLSRNFGHQTAIRAGMRATNGEAVVVMDADLQHPPELLQELHQKWREGLPLVNTRRVDDRRLPWFKRVSSRLFYRVLSSLSELELEPGSADFRLMDRNVVDQLNQFQESDLFWRGLVPWTGYESAWVSYKAPERVRGETKYTSFRMLRLAASGVTSFSAKPLHASILIGVFCVSLSLAYLIYALYIKFGTETEMPGWASIIFLILFVGGIQISMLGVIGVYIGKIFQQVKNRPPYLIKDQS